TSRTDGAATCGLDCSCRCPAARLRTGLTCRRAPTTAPWTSVSTGASGIGFLASDVRRRKAAGSSGRYDGGRIPVMSRTHPFLGLTAFVAIACLAGCESAKSANPTAPSVAGPIPGVNITAPRPLEPGAGATVVFSSEPPTLLIENAGTSGARTLWLQLEVGTDPNFQQIVYQADQIALGSNGRTAYRLPAPLRAGYTYF